MDPILTTICAPKRRPRMESKMRKVMTIVLAGVLWVLVSPAWAALEKAYTPEIYYVGVDGDTDKFQAHHWLSPGVDAGLGGYQLKGGKSWGCVELEMEGHALVNNADYRHEATLKKEDVGSLLIGYTQFRKYFDSQGGTYRYFTTLKTRDSGRDLYLDIGKLETRLKLERPNLPKLDFGYEYEFKRGTKSLLAWGSSIEGTTTRKIAPTWQDIDEEAHKFDVGLE